MPDLDSKRALTIKVSGAVQGVGFRPFVYKLARKHRVKGHVKNSPDGVRIFAQGDDASIHDFLIHLRSDAPPLAHIQDIRTHPATVNDCKNFKIIHSNTSGEKTAIILPDMSTCDDCLSDITDPGNRRYQYPFTNCTNCGPRFSIIKGLPYDRPATSMSNFEMCDECQFEYNDPNNRRFHAQPNACPDCGPQLVFWDTKGKVTAKKQDALLMAMDAIMKGKIIALKGLGGFQLICDARNPDAVTTLRKRKNRPAKPFAIMVKNKSMAEEFCYISQNELELLTAPQKPIVILDSKCHPTLSKGIAPGNPTLGVMLPYTPLHHLLMMGLGIPIVATSGNLANEPICIDEHEALERLAHIADGFLVHDRPIVRPVDDSVVRWMAGKRMIIRRARGFAPFPFHQKNGKNAILATGAHLKNTVTVTRNTQFFISQHIGNLESDLSTQTLVHVAKDLSQIYDINIQAVTCDHHPDYQSTHFAKSFGLPTYPVQHHLAHVWSVIGEHQLELPILGVAWDGTGLGMDDNIWGSEFFQITEQGWKRFAHLKPFFLPGGDMATKEPRRSALGLLYTAMGEAAFEIPQIQQAFTPEELTILHSQFAADINMFETTSMGRLFDGVSFLTGFDPQSQFEGQAAMDLEFSIGDFLCRASYPITLHHQDDTHELDWQTMILEIVDEIKLGISRQEIAFKFHQALSNVVMVIARLSRVNRVCLSGGCFQNKSLLEMTIQQLHKEKFSAYWNQEVPINDGGISFGQATAFYHGGQTPCV